MPRVCTLCVCEAYPEDMVYIHLIRRDVYRFSSNTICLDASQEGDVSRKRHRWGGGGRRAHNMMRPHSEQKPIELRPTPTSVTTFEKAESANIIQGS